MSWPWPCEWLPANTVTLPSLCTRTTALSQPPCRPPRLARLPLGPVPALSMKQARPMPIRTPCLRSSACSLAQRRIIRERQQLVEQRRRIAGIIDAPARRRIRKVAARDQIAPAKFDDVDAEFVRAALERAAR